VRSAVETPRVLVVNDEAVFVEMLVNWFRKRKLEAEGATSGDEARALMKRKDFDVVVLDIKMPGGLNGIGTLHEIRRIAPLTEVIVLTGHASAYTAVEAMKLGVFDYMLKPVRLEKLMLSVCAAFEKKGAQEEKMREMMHSPGESPRNEKD
jgi:DNA-binding NtrC family response regulator